MHRTHRIYILDAFHDAGVSLVRKHANVVNWDQPEVKQWPAHAQALMVRMTPVTKEQMQQAVHLKVICKQGVGTDTIDLVAAKALGIEVLTTPGINSEAVAEMAFSLGLSVCRRIARFDRLLRAGVPIVRPEHLGIEMHAKTVGVIGMGNIGTRVARKWMGAFDAKILAYDPFAPATAWSDIPHTRLHDLSELLCSVDLLTLHLPLTPQSRHMIGYKELMCMKPNAVLVNVSRGGIIDEQALCRVLENNHLFGVGLDVLEHEPMRSDNPLLRFEQITFTPHAAAGTHETQERSALQVATQVLSALQKL